MKMVQKISDAVVLRAALREDLAAFIVKVFRTICPEHTYSHNWHINALVHYLMLIHHGIDRRVIINMPPRTLKSMCISVAYVAWALGHNPAKSFACVSYSNVIATNFARQFQAVVKSPWYQRLFANVQFRKFSEGECETTKGGGRFVVPVGGSFTGRGADVIIVDDVIKAADAQSDKLRSRANDWYSETLPSRLDDKEKGAIIVAMQRLHEDDLCGKLLREGSWTTLCLPAIAEEDQEIPIGPAVVYHRERGELLHPARESLAALEEFRRGMSAASFSAQYQQTPIPHQGNLIKRAWLKWYEVTPNRGPGAQVIQSWDIASSTAETADFSVCTTWMVIKRDYFLLDVWRKRLQFPHLKRKLIELARAFTVDCILIEKSGPGLHLIQELRANPEPGVPDPVAITPEASKLVRMEAQSVRFETGQVFLPKEKPWLADYLHEILACPNARYDDQTDSTSQLLGWVEKRWRFSDPAYPAYGRPLVQYFPGGGVAIG
jgi:predicted phage terminase large subunit-like protein